MEIIVIETKTNEDRRDKQRIEQNQRVVMIEKTKLWKISNNLVSKENKKKRVRKYDKEVNRHGG